MVHSTVSLNLPALDAELRMVACAKRNISCITSTRNVSGAPDVSNIRTQQEDMVWYDSPCSHVSVHLGGGNDEVLVYVATHPFDAIQITVAEYNMASVLGQTATKLHKKCIT
jgi:hypothetical protein